MPYWRPRDRNQDESKRNGYKEQWLLIDDIPTRLLTWGYDVTDLEENSPQHMIFMITGNPGIADFYIEFLSDLHRNAGLPVVVASHAGHDIPDEDIFPAHLNQLYDLQLQIDQKLGIIQQLMPKNVKLYVIGHSMGAKVALELLKIPALEKNIEQCYMLFPTVERIGDTRNAQFIKPFIEYCGTFVIFLSWIFTLFPKMVKNILLKITFTLTYGGANDCTVQGGMKLIKPAVLRNIFHLTNDEMDKIKELDVETLKKNKHKLKFYYGTTDGWSPLKFYNNLLNEIPDIEAEVCNKGMKHAFTIKSAKIMSSIITDWIRTSLNG